MLRFYNFCLNQFGWTWRSGRRENLQSRRKWKHGSFLNEWNWWIVSRTKVKDIDEQLLLYFLSFLDGLHCNFDNPQFQIDNNVRVFDHITHIFVHDYHLPINLMKVWIFAQKIWYINARLLIENCNLPTLMTTFWNTFSLRCKSQTRCWISISVNSSNFRSAPLSHPVFTRQPSQLHDLMVSKEFVFLQT